MKSRRARLRLAAVVWLAAGTAGTAASTNPVVTTVSATGQFIAHSPDPLLSSALCAYGERIKHEWRQRLGVTGPWRDTIIFVVRARDAELTNAPALTSELFQIESKLRYQITCIVPPLDNAQLAAAIVEALCAEAANRDQPRTRGTPYVGAPIPVWLAEGFAQTLLDRSDELLNVVRRNINGTRPQAALELMQVVRLPGDATDRQLYRANAWLMTDSLLRLPRGPGKLRRLLAELGATKMYDRAFERVYSDDFPDTTALEKWWSLQQARARELTFERVLTVAETGRQLDTLLTVELDPHFTFAQLWRLFERSGFDVFVQRKQAALGMFRAYAHPLYRPVIAKYAESITHLRYGKRDRFQATVREAGQMRAAADHQSQQIEKALDRAERTYTSTGADAFQEFFRTLNQLEKFEQQRRNPIGDYLDKFDQ